MFSEEMMMMMMMMMLLPMMSGNLIFVQLPTGLRSYFYYVWQPVCLAISFYLLLITYVYADKL